MKRKFKTSRGPVVIDVKDSAFECEGFTGYRIRGEGCSAWDVRTPEGFTVPGDMPPTLGHVAEVIAAARKTIP